MILRSLLRCLAFLLVLSLPLAARSSEEGAARRFALLRGEPLLLYAFLKEMPKGGDLHNHLSGAVYAESYLQWGAADGLCVDPATAVVQHAPAPCAAGSVPLSGVLASAGSSPLYRQLIDAWSMRGYRSTDQNGHDRFFDTFGRFGAAGGRRFPSMVAEAANRAAADGLLYLELMATPDDGLAAAAGRVAGWQDDPAAERKALVAKGIFSAVSTAVRNLRSGDAEARRIMACGTADASPGCGVEIRYLFHAGRNHAPQEVFAQLLTAFEAASVEPKVVGVNLLQAEDGYLSMTDFPRHMKMLDYLHATYPGVHISLHAGELAPGLVPPEGLRRHVRDSVDIGHAERIGHGVDVMYEDRPEELLAEMAARNVAVEICLTSNDTILGVRGRNHPLSLYITAGVPVALATDDEGVSRSDMTLEFLRGVQAQGLDYPALKQMARASLQYAFVEGKPLWKNIGERVPAEPCASDVPGGAAPSPACAAFIRDSRKAGLQWELERRLRAFEERF